MIKNDLNFENQYLLNRNSDQKTLYMKIDQKNTKNMNTLSVGPPPPSNIQNIKPSPSGCPVR